MSIGALLFFFLFVATIVFSYIALRRRLARPMIVSAGCVLGSIVMMTAFASAQGAIFLHALLVGIILGGIISVSSLAVALYFQGNEMRDAKR